jgi:protease II
LIYEEKDLTFSVYVGKTKSKKYIIIAANQTLRSEHRYLDADRRAGQFRIFQPQRRDIDHSKDQFYIRTNYQAKSFRLMKTPVAQTALANWKEVIPNRDDVFLQGFDVFTNDLVVVERTLLKQDEVLAGFDRNNYRTGRLYATARDGVRVPVSIVYRTGMKKDGSSPVPVRLRPLRRQYGRGFQSVRDQSARPRLRLPHRAHTRRPGDGPLLVRRRKLLKKNTFTDFIDTAEYLVAQKYADRARIFANGGSAGGLLMRAVVNMRPDLFRSVIAGVPWVDVVTTMLDDSIPLTTAEYDEWGNPNDKTYYDYMLSYSPYDQVKRQTYPNMLVTTSLNDSQVQYFEPAKWVARLRATRTGNNLLMLKTEMMAGHGGASGRDKRYRDTALKYAFFSDLAGMKQEGRKPSVVIVILAEPRRATGGLPPGSFPGRRPHPLTYFFTAGAAVLW